MTLKDDIENIIFNVGQEINIHHLIDGNLILEINYEKYSRQILDKIKEHYPEIKIQDETI